MNFSEPGATRRSSSQLVFVGADRGIMKSKQRKPKEKPLVCTICGKPATTSVDGEPSCDEHISLVYENQVEDYTNDEQANNAWVKP